MSKNLLQDMVTEKRKRRPDAAVIPETRPVAQARGAEDGRNGNRPKYMLWLVAAISLGFFLFALSYMFLKVSVAVNPKTQDVAINANFSADKNAGEEVLRLDSIVISGEESKAVATTGEKDVSEPARGVVLIYNSFGAGAQRLNIDTRLEGSNGKIYKTEKQIIVPGMRGSVPGSVKVGIYGAEAGAEYNSAPLDFTIVGFKGTPKYAKFYARSAGGISGGFKGKAPIITSADREAAILDLKAALRAKLFKKATEQIPNGFILFNEAVFFKTDSINDSDASSGDGVSIIKIAGTLYGFLFNEEKLAKKIAEENIKEYDGSPVYSPNIRDLDFSFIEADKIAQADADGGEIKNINFHLKGAAKIVWKADEDKLAADLLGKSKKEFSRILEQYPNIDSAELSISPFWKMTFPDKIEDINVIVNYPK